MCEERHMKPLAIATLVIQSACFICQMLAHVPHKDAWESKNSVVARVLLVFSNAFALALLIILLVFLVCRKKVKQNCTLAIAIILCLCQFYLLIFALFFIGFCFEQKSTPSPVILIILAWFLANVVLILNMVIMIGKLSEGVNLSDHPQKKPIKKNQN